MLVRESETSRRFVDRPRHCVVVCQGPGGPQCAPPAGPPHPLHRRGGVHLRHGGHAGHPHRGCRSVVSCGKHCYRYLFADYTILVFRRCRGCFNRCIAGERGAVNRFISYKTVLCAPHVSGCETFLVQCAKSVALFIYYDLLLSKVNITSTTTHNKSRKLLFVELLLHFLDD